MKRLFLLFLFMLGIGLNFAQVSTTVTMGGSPISGSPFSSLAAAITAVNGLTITGPVVVTAAAGSETNPSGGYSITATGTATNTIIIQGAGAGSRAGKPSLVAHPGRLRQVDRQPQGELALCLGARGVDRPAPHPGAARQAAGRLVIDQRHGVRARPGAGLRHLGAARQSRLELSRGAADLPRHDRPWRRRRGAPRPTRYCGCGTTTCP